MALLVHWYDFICFGIVVGSFIASMWVEWRKELSLKGENNAIYESLLKVTGLESDDGLFDALPNNHLGSTQLWSSCWKGVHPGWLLAVRFCSFLTLAAFLAWDVTEWGGSVFIYYTEWTFALVMVYFAKEAIEFWAAFWAWSHNSFGISDLGTIASAYGCWMTTMLPAAETGDATLSLSTDVEEVTITTTTNSKTYKAINGARNSVKLQSQYAHKAFQLRAGFWGYLMQTAYQACAGAVVLTDIVFWSIIVPFLSDAHLRLNTLMGCMHTLNAFFLLLDTSLNSLPFPWFRIAYFVQWTCIYVVFQWVIHARGLSWWPYPFIELDTPWAPLCYFVVAVLHIPCYGIYVLIVKEKNRILPKLFPRAFVRSC